MELVPPVTPARPDRPPAHRRVDQPEVGLAGTALGLQRTAGNAAVAGLLTKRRPAVQRAATQVQREGMVEATTVKHTVNLPDWKIGEKDAGYAKFGLAAGGSYDLEYTPSSGGGEAAAHEGGEHAAAEHAGGEHAGGEGAAPHEGGTKLKPAAGASASPEGLKYQAEVTAEFEKETSGIFAGCTPKAKLGGEGNADKGKLGIEFSMEGDTFEPKFAFNLMEREGAEVKFLNLEAGVDWKMKERYYTTADGTKIKVTPKLTLKGSIEPEYKKIFEKLAEEAAEVITGEVLIAGSMILVGVATIAAFWATIDDGTDEAKAIDAAGQGRDELVAGFVAGATGKQLSGSQYTAEGLKRGTEWRAKVISGDNAKGLPVPAAVMDEKAGEQQDKIHKTAWDAANKYLHTELVKRYWEIHYMQKKLPWGEIETTYLMLMEGQKFGRPQPQEGRTDEGASSLAH
ncbi:hypothetical protein GCM10009765_29470 [Fodinicola feengrottensis]|uniref:Uncharacterized protein n=1 Tax=Fodinicola feengrottensis TaxID=435914 RepID=A0ABN2GX33_9ACTN